MTKGWLFAKIDSNQTQSRKKGDCVGTFDGPNGFLKSNGRKEDGVRRAHILVEAKPLSAKEVEQGISSLPDIISAESLLGPYDAVVVVERPSFEELQAFIAQVQQVEGVERTTTCLSVNLS